MCFLESGHPFCSIFILHVEFFMYTVYLRTISIHQAFSLLYYWSGVCSTPPAHGSSSLPTRGCRDPMEKDTVSLTDLASFIGVSILYPRLWIPGQVLRHMDRSNQGSILETVGDLQTPPHLPITLFGDSFCPTVCTHLCASDALRLMTTRPTRVSYSVKRKKGQSRGERRMHSNFNFIARGWIDCFRPET